MDKDKQLKYTVGDEFELDLDEYKKSSHYTFIKHRNFQGVYYPYKFKISKLENNQYHADVELYYCMDTDRVIKSEERNIPNMLKDSKNHYFYYRSLEDYPLFKQINIKIIYPDE